MRVSQGLCRQIAYLLANGLKAPLGTIPHLYRYATMPLTILLIVLVLALIGGLPSWPHAQTWSWGPSGFLGVVIVLIILWLLIGHRL